MKLFVFLSIVTLGLSLDCTQIPASYIHDGSSFYFPYNVSTTTLAPPNFNCTYTISALVTSTQVIFGTVILHNFLRGSQDRIITVDSFGKRAEYTSADDTWIRYEVFPGKPMTVQVLTGSVNASSKFQIHVRYSNAKIGGVNNLRSGGSMNFLDVSTLGGNTGEWSASSATILAKEQMSVTIAMSSYNWPATYLYYSYLIDGDFYHQVKVQRLFDIAQSGQYISSSNNVTIVNFQNISYPDVAVVLNRLSEVKDLGGLSSAASTQIYDNQVMVMGGGERKNAVQILDVQSRKITMNYLSFNGTIPLNCVAQVVTGPPNQYSQLLLDLTKSVDLMPYTFNLKYFSILAQNCDFSFSVVSPTPF